MEQSVDNTLYLWFKIWKLKCEFILEVEVASLPDVRKCKTLLLIIRKPWSRDVLRWVPESH